MKSVLERPVESFGFERGFDSIRGFTRFRPESTQLACLVLLGIQSAWLVVALTNSRFHLALSDPGGVHAERRFVAVAYLAIALVLLSLAHAVGQPRLRWLVLGLAIHAVGTTLFGDLLIQSLGTLDTHTQLMGSVLSRAAMVVFAAVGILLANPPLLTARLAAAMTAGYLALVALLIHFSDLLPSLVTFDRIPAEPATGITSGFSGFYWLLGIGVVGLSFGVALVAARRRHIQEFGSWFFVSLCLLAGYLLHSWFRPSLYGVSTEFTTANALMTINFAVIMVGATLELRKVADRAAADRDALAVETQRLGDLERLRADFTTVVAHELVQPLLAIRRTAEALALDDLSPAQQRAVGSITTQATTLFAMIDDVRASGTTRSEDLSIHITRVQPDGLFERVRTYAETLPGNHPVGFEQGLSGEIWADEDRIAQVLRNLLTNAGRYTPAGTIVTVRAIPITGTIARIEIEDEGPGIDASAIQRVFRKFERGTSDEPGLGVGLYLSQRILQCSGSNLMYRAGSRGGACFWFDLPRVS